ncbi:MAG TPA: hypothetical protein VKZ18_13490 [Polyangia bacterium]|nr:hypothetical protein [Polyangia bacterium]
MSVHVVRFIPVDPRFVPGAEADAAALATLRAAAPDAEDVSSETDEHVVFRDCGENFERIRCPACGAEIAIPTWQAWMDADYDGAGFRLAPVTMPCCARRETLDDLGYDPPQGFSRYALGATNVRRQLTPRVLRDLEEALGCRLRTIHQMI